MPVKSKTAIRPALLPNACLALLCILGTTSRAQSGPAPANASTAPSEPHASATSSTGSITGTVVDASGAVVSDAQVQLTEANQASAPETVTGDNGQFTFSGVPTGSFQIAFRAPGFVTRQLSGSIAADETYIVPTVTLSLSEVMTRVTVIPQDEIAKHEVKQEEKQRVLGVVPNFYVAYFGDAAPLSTKQKFELAWKSMVDPFTFAITAGVAGSEQAENSFSGYGDGAQGYGKRFGAFYADTAAGTFIGSAILPSVLKQDPRYFYKGSGSARSRILYALANAVICRGDNQRWQANYSNIIGSFAAGGVANVYYPAQNRTGAGLTFENGLINIGAGAAANVLQEFVAKKFTPRLPSRETTAALLKPIRLTTLFPHEGQ